MRYFDSDSFSAFEHFMQTFFICIRKTKSKEHSTLKSHFKAFLIPSIVNSQTALSVALNQKIPE